MCIIIKCNGHVTPVPPSHEPDHFLRCTNPFAAGHVRAKVDQEGPCNSCVAAMQLHTEGLALRDAQRKYEEKKRSFEKVIGRLGMVAEAVGATEIAKSDLEMEIRAKFRAGWIGKTDDEFERTIDQLREERRQKQSLQAIPAVEANNGHSGANSGPGNNLNRQASLGVQRVASKTSMPSMSHPQPVAIANPSGPPSKGQGTAPILSSRATQVAMIPFQHKQTAGAAARLAASSHNQHQANNTNVTSGQHITIYDGPEPGPANPAATPMSEMSGNSGQLGRNATATGNEAPSETAPKTLGSTAGGRLAHMSFSDRRLISGDPKSWTVRVRTYLAKS